MPSPYVASRDDVADALALIAAFGPAAAIEARSCATNAP